MAARWRTAADRMTAAEDEAHYCDGRAVSLEACACALLMTMEARGAASTAAPGVS